MRASLDLFAFLHDFLVDSLPLRDVLVGVSQFFQVPGAFFFREEHTRAALGAFGSTTVRATRDATRLVFPAIYSLCTLC